MNNFIIIVRIFAPLIIGLISCFQISTGQTVMTGIEVLESYNFKELQGKNVGLITNPTGINRSFRSTADILFTAPGVKLVALFGPEHGVRGDFSAGEKVGKSVDAGTGLPVYSLYGSTRKPDSTMLTGIDVLVYDIQDIGSRSYTYISTLGLAMEAAAENNVRFIVLDRPNPLGGKRIEGPTTEHDFISFVSQYPIPYIHGFTVGELAKFLNGEGLLRRGVKCDLEVIPMKGWTRGMTFGETSLPWVPSSPHIPSSLTTAFYPATGILGELYVASIGVGYTLPFQVVASEWYNADSLSENLNDLALPGVIFRPIHYKPYYSVSQGKMVHGVQIHITNYTEAPISLLQFYILQEAYKLWPEKNVFEMCDKTRIDMFDKVCGTDSIRIVFTKRFMVDDIIDLWTRDIPEFRKTGAKYLLYR